MRPTTIARRTRRRLSRFPARRPIITDGTNSANSSADTQPGDPVTSYIRIESAIAAIQVPSTLTEVASQKRRKPTPFGPITAGSNALGLVGITPVDGTARARMGSLARRLGPPDTQVSAKTLRPSA